MEPDQEFLEFVVKAIVDNPGDVQTSRKVDEMGVLLTLKVHSGDMGGIIGKNGATARALRTLLRVVGAKNNARVNLKIEEPDRGGESAPSRDGQHTSALNDSSANASNSANADSQSVDEAIEELKM